MGPNTPIQNVLISICIFNSNNKDVSNKSLHARTHINTEINDEMLYDVLINAEILLNGN